MPQRIYVVGTDTEIGKTTFLERVLEQARIEGVAAIPFKPAQSGDLPHDQSDAGRLMKAAGLASEHLDLVSPHRYAVDRAPGCADPESHFIQNSKTPNLSPLQYAQRILAKLEAQEQPAWTFCEGAGGLHVPMPGGTWQPRWIQALAQHCIVVAPVGLGTINHTLLTINALRQLELNVLGIAWTGARATDVDLAKENMDIVQHHTGCATLAHPHSERGIELIEDFFSAIQTRVAS